MKWTQRGGSGGVDSAPTPSFFLMLVTLAVLFFKIQAGHFFHFGVSKYQFSSVAQSCPTLYDPMTQHARPPCPSPTPGVHLDSRPSSQ